MTLLPPSEEYSRLEQENAFPNKLHFGKVNDHEALRLVSSALLKPLYLATLRGKNRKQSRSDFANKIPLNTAARIAWGFTRHVSSHSEEQTRKILGENGEPEVQFKRIVKYVAEAYSVSTSESSLDTIQKELEGKIIY